MTPVSKTQTIRAFRLVDAYNSGSACALALLCAQLPLVRAPVGLTSAHEATVARAKWGRDEGGQAEVFYFHP